MSVETQQQKEDQFGSRKVTQAETALFVQRSLQPVIQRMLVLQNAIDSLFGYLGEVGINGEKLTQEMIVAFVQSKNAQTTGKPNGAAS